MSWDDARAKLKRFYKHAELGEVDGGYTLLLDRRPLRTPARAPFVAPRPAAAMAAAEWNSQSDVVDPLTMPTTRTINSAIDRVAPARDAVVDDVAGYGGSDLICYRADGPAALVVRQRAAWDPLIDWSAEALGAALSAQAGVMFVEQSPTARGALRRAVADRSDLSLAALHELTTLSGSLIIALAVDRVRLAPEAAWSSSRVDEDWQIEQWGRDAEAAETTARRAQDFLAAAQLIAALGAGDAP